MTRQLEPGLRAGAQALGLQPSDQQIVSLLAYLALISKWNRVYNLTAIRSEEEMLIQHLLDSLAVVAPLRRHTHDSAASLLDVGSGAGLPGVVIALMCPEISVTCVDAVTKKSSFIRQVAAELGVVNLHGVHARVEDLEPKPWDAVTSRAFSSLEQFTRLTEPLLKTDGVWMALKGRRPDDEIAELPKSVDMFHVEHIEVPQLDAQRCIVWMRKR